MWTVRDRQKLNTENCALFKSGGWRQSSAIAVMTRGFRIRGSNPSRGKIFFIFSEIAQTYSVAHPASCLVGKVFLA